MLPLLVQPLQRLKKPQKLPPRFLIREPQHLREASEADVFSLYSIAAASPDASANDASSLIFVPQHPRMPQWQMSSALSERRSIQRCLRNRRFNFWFRCRCIWMPQMQMFSLLLEGLSVQGCPRKRCLPSDLSSASSEDASGTDAATSGSTLQRLKKPQKLPPRFLIRVPQHLREASEAGVFSLYSIAAASPDASANDASSLIFVPQHPRMPR